MFPYLQNVQYNQEGARCALGFLDSPTDVLNALYK